jgi:hypothetical protein
MEASRAHARPDRSYERQVRLGRNEAAFRERNERIDELNQEGAHLPSFDVVCECGDLHCLESFRVEVGVYQEVRSHPDRFLVLAGHDAPDVEAVAEAHDGFVVVEKHPGVPSEVAEHLDPRSGSAGMDSARRIAENEARFRRTNERIEKAGFDLEPQAPTMPFVCECGRPDCMQVLRLSFEEYERARAHPRHFLCVPGHEIEGEDLGRVVERARHFVIVEKIGESAEVAETTDPRAHDER